VVSSEVDFSKLCTQELVQHRREEIYLLMNNESRCGTSVMQQNFEARTRLERTIHA
jgi:hypothetical protein